MNRVLEKLSRIVKKRPVPNFDISDLEVIRRFIELSNAAGVEVLMKDRWGSLVHVDSHYDFALALRNERCTMDALPMLKAIEAGAEKYKLSVDVGANVGLTSLFLAARSSKVIAFEPEPKNLKRFRDHLSVNRIANIDIIPMAVSAETGAGELQVSESYGHHSLGKIFSGPPIQTVSVKTVSLDDYFEGTARIDFLKVDVEGFEEEVFFGARKLLSEKRIGKIAFEVSKLCLEAQGKRASTILDILDRANYRVTLLDGSMIDRTTIDSIHHADLFAVPV